MTAALFFLGWLGLGFGVCWAWDVAKVPGERQRMVSHVRYELNWHYMVSGLDPMKWNRRG
jgi:hypothetical protein